jgi:hypothetical protein
MKLFKLNKHGKDKALASISNVSTHIGATGDLVPHIMLGCGDSSYRVDMTTEEANNLIKHLRQQIEYAANSGENGRVDGWYGISEINPDLIS